MFVVAKFQGFGASANYMPASNLGILAQVLQKMHQLQKS